MSKVTIGGDRLGAGKKQEVSLRNYERSTHDLSYVWRSTMSSGTLVPFMTEVALPGDTFDIDLECDIKTHPTIGPLFGSYKVQLDVFQAPIRLYQGKLHMNMLNIGMEMQNIKLPQIVMVANNEIAGDNSQINPSSIFSYLNIRGLGQTNDNVLQRQFNAIPWLAYWDIYKQYYANKQEEKGAVIHNPQNNQNNQINYAYIKTGSYENPVDGTWTGNLQENSVLIINFTQNLEPDETGLYISYTFDGNGQQKSWNELFTTWSWDETLNLLTLGGPSAFTMNNQILWDTITYNQPQPNQNIPRVALFDLENIDNMRKTILANVNDPNALLLADWNTQAPYSWALRYGDSGLYCKQSTQEGLGLKTYQSDLFNNWISTDWIDGANGINAITAIDTSTGEFTIDTLQLSRKVYDMLNRIAISGGTYDDWLDAVYSHERTRSIENPIYMGGLIKELAFQEVISTTASETSQNEQPLGTLAGRGVLTKKNKGGKISIRVNEPSYIMGIISLTPRVDYSQGNKWDTNLKTMDDLHKPALDEIGFQDLITDQMAWWDTEIVNGAPVYKSAGKQPAWINYMTNVNQCRGNFADENQQMFMTLNRRYEKGTNGIKDLTTYIDPSKFNNIFADTRLDAQNFWAQIGVNIEARRKLSAKLMPNL